MEKQQDLKVTKKDFTSKVKSLKAEDFLNREEIKIENEKIRLYHLDKVILVTGGAGSIGSEIIRKVSLFKPNKIIIVDQAETPLNDIKVELETKYPEIEYSFHLADISNIHRIETLFKNNNISIVYHAAAYKHVPIIEANPSEAINVNIVGTCILADLSSKYKIDRFIMISTDKAVNPASVMGASKRVAELYIQSLQQSLENTTKFIITRSGNVIGSSGSVFHLFKKQIEEGGPITITDKNVTRYFMTINEACELVLQAGIMGQGGEIFIFDMGTPIKILDLAQQMIQQSNLTPNDIPIQVTGLRPGEKLHEKLFTNEINILPTHHKKIMRLKDTKVNYKKIYKKIISLARKRKEKTDLELVAKLKSIIPEYISQNSVFEKLDKKDIK